MVNVDDLKQAVHRKVAARITGSVEVNSCSLRSGRMGISVLLKSADDLLWAKSILADLYSSGLVLVSENLNSDKSGRYLLYYSIN